MSSVMQYEIDALAYARGQKAWAGHYSHHDWDAEIAIRELRILVLESKQAAKRLEQLEHITLNRAARVQIVGAWK